ncbi:MAG: pectate lyase [Ignavibacteria bacterium]|nr:pectate lyase [Ignavibacteria bacterium]
MNPKNVLILLLILSSYSYSQQNKDSNISFDLYGFYDSSHHWYDINDQEKIITPIKNQPRYRRNEITKIADNILLFQKDNGGWPKNYDMLAVLTDEQKEIVKKHRSSLNTTFDNGTTYTQTDYLAKTFYVTKDERYKEGFLKGLNFILSAQYANGGWPQFYPDTSGYQKFITFNDGAMIGVMKLLQKIVNREKEFFFLTEDLFDKVKLAFNKGIECIINCQINENNKLTAWCQQHDNVTLKPTYARTYELPSICNMESAEIVEFLMSIENPNERIINSVKSAVRWFEESKILGIRVETVQADKTEFMYHTTDVDKIVVEDSSAPPIWTRFYELETHRPLFANRDGIKVYSMDKVERERRTGYAWYTYAPQAILDKYSDWISKLN